MRDFETTQVALKHRDLGLKVRALAALQLNWRRVKLMD